MYQFCIGDLNKFVLLLRKGVYLYEYMDSWERFNETPLLPKKDFFSELNLEDITDKDYNHAQKMFKEFCSEIGDYHDLHVQCDTLFLADVFEKFRDDKSIESSYLTYSGVNNLYGWAMSQKLPVNDFKWENDLSRFNEAFMKNYNENSDVGYFL